jgi:ATP-binding cassette, subfamily B, bacterial PglK
MWSLFKFFFKSFSKKEKKWFFLSLGMGFSSALIELLTASIVFLVGRALFSPESLWPFYKKIGMEIPSHGRSIAYSTIFLGLFFIVKNIFLMVDIVVRNRFAERVSLRLQSEILRAFFRLPYDRFLLSYAPEAQLNLRNVLPSVVPGTILSVIQLFSYFLMLFFFIVLIAKLTFVGSLIILGYCLVLFCFFHKIFAPKSSQFVQSLKERSQNTTGLQNIIVAFRELFLRDRGQQTLAIYREVSIKEGRAGRWIQIIDTLPRLIIETSLVNLFVIFTCYLCWSHANPQKIVGLWALLLYVGFRLMPIISTSFAALIRLKGYLPILKSLRETFTKLLQEPCAREYPDLTFEKNVVVDNAFFSYEGAQEHTLKGISLEIKKGECVGIVGQTGSGKSTLIQIILGLLSPIRGHVLVDDRFPTMAPQWHQKIGYVSQEPYIFRGTLASNIALGVSLENIDFSKIEKIIEHCQLKSVVENFPGGLRGDVSDRGTCFSGGERQRIALARALYLDPEFLVLDEATSALDEGTEYLMMKAIVENYPDTTMIMVAHRLNTLQYCSRIFSIDQGLLVKVQTFEELMEGHPRKIHQAS